MLLSFIAVLMHLIKKNSNRIIATLFTQNNSKYGTYFANPKAFFAS